MELELEILEYSYWEHFKFAKDLSLILPLKHSKRLLINKELDKILKRIHEIKNEMK
ncbi:hypothetical protein [Tenacibaculum finnmarkense]|uniref:hypothetical protein n=1 Tax=Tenacibaculum finnmarkense TaxID=2781243 RepID=UPI00187B5C25|nr:hypothetical protein [Tenacibaculum finnmarkense]MBE7649247.1 hypothetical protein [Tenacibaculum finnmarkense genomovar ulcerans]